MDAFPSLVIWNLLRLTSHSRANQLLFGRKSNRDYLLSKPSSFLKRNSDVRMILLTGFKVQCALFNGIRVNGIILLMGSNITRFNSPKLFFNTSCTYISSSFAYCYHLVNVISLVWPIVIPLSSIYCC